MRAMLPRVTAAALLLLVLTGCTMWSEKQRPAWSSATGPEAFERLLWQEIQAGNWDELEKHLAVTFKATLPQGVYDRDGVIAAWKQEQGRPVSLGEFAVEPNGDSMVVTYTAQAAGGGPRRMMTVWQQVHGEGWVAIAHAEVSAGSELPKM